VFCWSFATSQSRGRPSGGTARLKRVCVTYRYRLQDLLVLLGSKAPAQATELVSNHRHVLDGLISIGLKIHCLDEGRQFDQLVEGLGGASEILEINFYKHANASLCLVLPPVGSATSAIQLLECIETFIGSSIFGNPRIQLQICSPGRLSAHASALLAIGFYLGSDTLRRYTRADLRTTFTSWYYVNGRGIRLVLYDAKGDFDRNFDWWNQYGIVERELPLTNGRTDLLVGSGSRLDIRNVNLIATLLVHAEYDGYWRLLGEQFKYEMEALLQRHLLPGLLAAPWVCKSTARSGDDDRFFAALQELVAYAYGESARIKQPRFLIFNEWLNLPARPPNGILEETQILLSKYAGLLERNSRFVTQAPGEAA